MKTQNALPAVFQQASITFHEVQGGFCLTAGDLNKGLGYENPRAVLNLYNRHQDELEECSSIIKLMTDAGQRETRVFTEEGIYLASMLAKTEKAKEFRQNVAKVLKNLRQHKLVLARAEGSKATLALTDRIRRTGKPDNFVKRLTRYNQKGLTNKEIGKLLDIAERTVQEYKHMLRQSGLWDILGSNPKSKIPGTRLWVPKLHKEVL